MTQVWQLAEAVALRPEAFGGMAFHRDQGITLEVDKEAYDFLRTCLSPGPLPSADHPASHLVPQLVRLGFFQPTTKVAQPAGNAPHAPWAGDGVTLSAPETVHVAVTTRCNQSCPGCYVPRREGKSELTVADWCDLIAQWAQMWVFQIAVGGGEPLLYDGLFEVLACAREQGLVPNLTTNGTLLDVDTVRRLQQAGVARVNVSWFAQEGQPLYDPESDRAFVETFKAHVPAHVRVVEMDTHLNDPRVGEMAVQLMKEMLPTCRSTYNSFPF